MGRAKDLTGQQFGRLTAISVAGRDHYRNNLWTCQCECGNETRATTASLMQGSTKSCGCLRLARGGITTRPEFGVWNDMRGRCNNPRYKNYKNYGGRGISVCERWRKFEYFLADMGPRPSPSHSIERIDNHRNYEPENCRWATRAEQQRNKRNNRTFTINGETKCLTDWASEAGVSRSTVRRRLKNGMTIEEALGLTVSE